MDGIGNPCKDANAEIKIRDVCGMVGGHDITVLVETRTNKLERILPFLPGYAVHIVKMADELEGRKGHGIAVLTAPHCTMCRSCQLPLLQ